MQNITKIPFSDGIYTNITNEQYNEIDAIDDFVLRSTFIKMVANDPREAWLDKMGYTEKSESKSMEIGSLFHEAILEPKKYQQKCLALKEYLDFKQIVDIAKDNHKEAQKNKKLAKLATKDEIKELTDIIKTKKINYDALKEELDEKNVDVSEASLNKVNLMFEIFKTYTQEKNGIDFYKLMQIGVKQKTTELTIITNGKKIRIDCLLYNKNANTYHIYDLKTTKAKKFDYKFRYELNDYKYALQMCFYRDVFQEALNRCKHAEIHSDIKIEASANIETGLIICSTLSPFNCAYLDIEEYYLNIAKNELNDVLSKIEEQKEKYGFKTGFENMWDSSQEAILSASDFFGI